MTEYTFVCTRCPEKIKIKYNDPNIKLLTYPCPKCKGSCEIEEVGPPFEVVYDLTTSVSRALFAKIDDSSPPELPE